MASLYVTRGPCLVLAAVAMAVLGGPRLPFILKTEAVSRSGDRLCGRWIDPGPGNDRTIDQPARRPGCARPAEGLPSVEDRRRCGLAMHGQRVHADHASDHNCAQQH